MRLVGRSQPLELIGRNSSALVGSGCGMTHTLWQRLSPTFTGSCLDLKCRNVTAPGSFEQDRIR